MEGDAERYEKHIELADKYYKKIIEMDGEISRKYFDRYYKLAKHECKELVSLFSEYKN